VRALARPTIVIALAVLLPAAGCGTADREADVAAVTDRFHAALEGDAGSGGCAALSSETIKKLEQQEKRPCERAILALDLPSRARIASADVYVTSAYADLGDAGADFLDRGPGGWKISAAGCTPSEPDRPYDCELEG
jgi:uncharacterized protein YceK